MTVLHLAVADDDVLRRHGAFASVAVTSALDGDTVVACVEETVFDEDPVAALRIAAVAIGTVVDHLHPADGDIGRVEGMDDPEGRAQQRDILEQDALALIEADELWAQTILRAKHALGRALTFLIIHGDAVLAVLQQTGTGATTLTDHALLPSEAGVAVHRPPGVVGTTAVDGSLACDGNILSPEGIDTGREIEALQSLP